MTEIRNRLAAVALYLKQNEMTAYVIPTADPHMSEYLDLHYRFREWLSGFTGSAGILVVCNNGEACLWTDSRYWEQAQKEIEPNGIKLFRYGAPGVPSYADWMAEHFPKGSVVGYDPTLFSCTDLKRLEEKLSASDICLPADENLVNSVWNNRPPLKSNPIYEHDISPRSREQKLIAVRKKLKEKNADFLLVTSLDEVAWLFNLRGNDIPHNPVFYGYAVIPTEDTSPALFVNRKELPELLQKKLEKEGIQLCEYSDFSDYLQRRVLDKDDHAKCWLDPNTTNSRIGQMIPAERRVEGVSPIVIMKAAKTQEEIELIRQAHLKDGIAMVKFLTWLDKAKETGNETEISVAEKLLEYRREQPGFKDVSFETIAAFGPNAAQPHYQATENHCSAIAGDGFLLIDSGAQFPEGTTDITRTIAVGTPSKEMIRDYTAVLKSHIRLVLISFPEGVSSQVLDTVSRVPVWKIFADYGHGTGHGVGFFLNVHEGPQRISYPRITASSDAVVRSETAMLAGMVTSNEPGLYREGRWGIRIENLIVPFLAASGEFGSFLKFETLTLCPIDLSCVDLSALSLEEKDWINRYHKKVRRILMPYLEDDRKTADWLYKKTKTV